MYMCIYIMSTLSSSVKRSRVRQLSSCVLIQDSFRVVFSHLCTRTGQLSRCALFALTDANDTTSSSTNGGGYEPVQSSDSVGSGDRVNSVIATWLPSQLGRRLVAAAAGAAPPAAEDRAHDVSDV